MFVRTGTGGNLELTLNRITHGSATIGDFLIDSDWFCFSLEDEVREVPGAPVAQWKVNGKTAIPRGRYRVIITMSKRFGRLMPELLSVPGFIGIRIHPGNTADDTEGCILLGMTCEGNLIYKSKVAFGNFFPKLKTALAAGQECWITID